MALPIPILVVRNRSLPIAPTGNDGHRAKIAEALSEGICVITFVGDQPFCAIEVVDQEFSGSHIAHIARREPQGEWATDYIGEDMKFAGLATPRWADALRFRPPLPPKAARCALT